MTTLQIRHTELNRMNGDSEVQTFLPYPDFAQSAQCLDRQRLGKQRVEVLQLLKALKGESKGWKNHPAAKMWADRKSVV